MYTLSYSSTVFYHRTLNIAPSARQQDLVICPFCSCQVASAKPKPPTHQHTQRCTQSHKEVFLMVLCWQHAWDPTLEARMFQAVPKVVKSRGGDASSLTAWGTALTQPHPGTDPRHQGPRLAGLPRREEGGCGPRETAVLPQFVIRREQHVDAFSKHCRHSPQNNRYLRSWRVWHGRN